MGLGAVSTIRNIMSWNSDDKTYRVTVDRGTKVTNVVCIGMDAIDSELEGVYLDTSHLPDWVQRKLAVLAMTDPKPPPNQIDGVGVRINEDTFWIYHE